MNGYIGTMTTADTLGMYAVLVILALLALALLSALVVQIRDNDNDGLFPITDALGKSDYAELADEREAVAHLKQEHVTPLEFDDADWYKPVGYRAPVSVVPPMVGRHRRELLCDTGAWPVVVERELVNA